MAARMTSGSSDGSGQNFELILVDVQVDGAARLMQWNLLGGGRAVKLGKVSYCGSGRSRRRGS
jgi:hypothetical protein